MTSRYLTPQLQKIRDPVRFFSLSLSLSLFSGGTLILTKVPGSRWEGTIIRSPTIHGLHESLGLVGFYLKSHAKDWGEASKLRDQEAR